MDTVYHFHWAHIGPPPLSRKTTLNLFSGSKTGLLNARVAHPKIWSRVTLIRFPGPVTSKQLSSRVLRMSEMCILNLTKENNQSNNNNNNYNNTSLHHEYITPLFFFFRDKDYENIQLLRHLQWFHWGHRWTRWYIHTLDCLVQILGCGEVLGCINYN